MHARDELSCEFVTRIRGQWCRCPLTSFDPVDAALGEVVDLVADGPPDPGPGHDVLAADASVREVWGWIGLVRDGRVWIEDVAGAPLDLDAWDLRLLDAVASGTSVAAAAHAAGLDATAAGRRLARLAGAGRMVVTDAGTPTAAVQPPDGAPAHVVAPARAGGRHGAAILRRSATEVAERVGTAYRLSSKLAPVRRRLAHLGIADPSETPAAAAAAPEVPASASPGAAPPAETVAPAPAPSAAVIPSETVGAVRSSSAPVAPDVDEGRHPDDDGPPGRVPVYAAWHPHVGPLLSLGLLAASARSYRDGALTSTYEIRRPEHADSFLRHLPATGPAILLVSDYVWSLEANIDLARRALAVNPDLFVIHGGPSCPKYEGDAADFLREHGDVAHVLVRGEGEEVICDLLEALAPAAETSDRLTIDPDALTLIDGITFRGSDGEIVRTAERDRISDLNAVPSPYLTGEFDHIDASAWNYCLPIETSRGCPYGCTFCDWGSSTMSRIRKFDFDRVTAEIDWAAERNVEAVNIADANFGIMKRDVDTARYVADARRRTGFPHVLAFYPAKNTTKHLVRIMDLLGEANIASAASLSLQTTDAATLEALDRANIATDHFVSLAADHRRRGHPLLGDLLIGIPEQTYETYRRDLQFMLDHEILVRSWPVQMLPNSPMNDPEYKAKHGLVVDDRHLVVGANSFGEDDRRAMLRLRMVDIVSERLGVLRHVMRWMQWDHGVEATRLMDHLIRVVDDTPERAPSLAYTLRNFDVAPTAAIGWASFYDDVRAVLVEDFAVTDTAALDCVLAVQRHLMPQPGRSFPATIDLAFDYVAYYRDGAASLHRSGRAGAPPRPLADYGPGSLTVVADPLGLCTRGPEDTAGSRSETMQGDFLIGAFFVHELQSPLTRPWPIVVANGMASDLFDDVVPPDAEAASSVFDALDQDDADRERFTTHVDLGPRRVAHRS